MKKHYKSIENGVEYTIIESDDCKDLNDCHNVKCKIPGYIKIVIEDGRNETFYFYNNIEYNFCVMHNLYGPSWSRLLCKDKYYIFDIQYEYNDWIIKRNYYLRKEKLLEIKKASEF